MIYSVYWLGLHPARVVSNGVSSPVHQQSRPFYKDLVPFVGQSFNQRKLLAEVIKESTDNLFCFITTNDQRKEFTDWIKTNQLEDYVMYEMPQPITNGNHPSSGRNLTLTVIGTKQNLLRELYED